MRGGKWAAAGALATVVACGGSSAKSAGATTAPVDATPEGTNGTASSMDGSPGADVGAADSSGGDRTAPMAGEAGTDGEAAVAADSGAQDGRAPDAAGPFQRGTAYSDPLPAPDTRTAMPVAEGFSFLEGPVWVEDEGALYFSDMIPGTLTSTIHRFVPGQGATAWVPNAGSNGLALDGGGNILASTHDEQTLSRFDLETKARTTLELDYLGHAFNSPNDLVVRSDGTVYFTDPDWQLNERPNATGITGVYRMAPNGQISLVDATLNKPNGITLSLDEKRLYVGSLGQNILAYPVSTDGSTGSSETFTSLGTGSDGMTLDCAGNLYVTADTVRVFSPEGEALGEIATAETPTNVAFGGDAHTTLFITAGTRLYAIELNVPGMPY